MKSFKMMAAVAVAGVCAMGADSVQAGMFDWMPFNNSYQPANYRPAPVYQSSYAPGGQMICGPNGCYRPTSACVNGNCSNGCCVNGRCTTGQCATGQCANGQCRPAYGNTTYYRGGTYGSNCPGGVCPVQRPQYQAVPSSVRPVNYQAAPYQPVYTAPRGVQQVPVNQVTQARLTAPVLTREPSPFYP